MYTSVKINSGTKFDMISERPCMGFNASAQVLWPPICLIVSKIACNMYASGGLRQVEQRRAQRVEIRANVALGIRLSNDEEIL